MSSGRLRLFVALELTATLRDALERWRAPVLNTQPGLRPVTREALHLTLCFLGSQPAAETEAIAHACGAVASMPAPSLGFSAALWLPRRRPRVLALALADPARRLGAVQASLSARLLAGGWYVPESRTFLPHISLARVAGSVRAAGPPLPDPPAVTASAEGLTLFRSHLGRGGASYERLASVRLGG